VVEKLDERLGGDLNVAEDQNRVELQAGDFEQNLVILFDVDAVARLAQDRALLGYIEDGHGYSGAWRSSR
jgi:hypothetical protein